MKTRFTDEQIMQMLKEQEAGERTADVCRRYALPGRVLHSNIPRGGLAR
ncbi:transposase [Aliiroseovarius crassostreae]|nr:transposase [Aliiroseovarius crassostreae]